MCIDPKHREMSDAYYEMFEQPEVSFCEYVRSEFFLAELENWYDKKNLADVRNIKELITQMKQFLDDGHINRERLAKAVQKFRSKCPEETKAIPKKFATRRLQVYRQWVLCILGMMIIEYGRSKGRFVS